MSWVWCSVNIRTFQTAKAEPLNLMDWLLLSCPQLRSAGSQILEGCIAEITNISSLDISDNSESSEDTGMLSICSDPISLTVHVPSMEYAAYTYYFNYVKGPQLICIGYSLNCLWSGFNEHTIMCIIIHVYYIIYMCQDKFSVVLSTMLVS